MLQQTQNCYASAVKYGGVDTDAVIDGLFEEITSSPLWASNPGAYIDAHPIEIRELTYYGDYTRDYILTRFLAGGETGLKGHIMRYVLDVLAPEDAREVTASNGQEYFNKWMDAARIELEREGADWLRDNRPASYRAFVLLGGIG